MGTKVATINALDKSTSIARSPTMSRQAAYIEEFDDDTDLPLPTHTLPNTGTHGALLEELHISDDEFQPPSSQAGPARQQRSEQSGDASRRITDTTPYKSCAIFSSSGVATLMFLHS